MRDAIRYRQKRISGKSGDSGDDVAIDESSQDAWNMEDSLAFLAPTAFRFPRKTTILGGLDTETETPSTSFTKARTSNKATKDGDSSIPDFDDEASGSTIYSYVCIHIKCNISLFEFAN